MFHVISDSYVLVFRKVDRETNEQLQAFYVCRGK